MTDLHLFDLNEDIRQRILDSKSIPVDFYNKQGQVIIHKKPDVAEHEIHKLFKISERGIYYREADLRLFTGEITEPEPPQGFSNVKLFTEQMMDGFGNDLTSIFSDLKNTSISSIHAQKSRQRVTEIFDEFQSNPDVMPGLLNIVNLLKGKNFDVNVQAAMKRAIIAMSIKTRGMMGTGKARQIQLVNIGNLMMTALFTHVGTVKMDIPTTQGLTAKEREYISQYPFVSYLMLVHEPTIDPNVKYNILRHRMPSPSKGNSNNYPDLKWMLSKLKNMSDKYKEQGRVEIASDMLAQIKRFLAPYDPSDDDVPILSLATEFASLTTDTKWRKAFSPLEATRIMLNESLYSYHVRSTREFIDYAAISLSENQKLIREGTMVITQVSSNDKGSEPVYEVAQVVEEYRLQSRPVIKRLGTISAKPKHRNDKKIIPEFIPTSFTKDRRAAVYNLNQDHTRYIVFLPDNDSTPELLETITT